MTTHSFQKIVFFAVAATLLWSCGDSNSKKNTVNSQTNGINLPLSDGVNLPAQGVAQMSTSNYSTLLARVSCRTGQRLQQMYTFSSSSFTGSSKTTIQGSFNAGGIGGSSIAKEYIGISAFGDVMIAQKISNGSQVIGYNVILSMCSMSSNNGAPYISDTRQLTSFAGKLILDDEVNCGHGMIDSAQTTMQSQVAASHPYLPVFKVDTWFTKVGCVQN